MERKQMPDISPSAYEADDLLKCAVEYGIVDMSEIIYKIELSKREEILKKHKYEIWPGSDGKWKTYLPDKTSKYKRKLIRGSTKVEVEDRVVDFYLAQEKKKKEPEKKKTFDDAYWRWRKTQDLIVESDNSISKYDTDYIRFFKDDDFSKMNLEDITVEHIKVFICRKIKELQLCQSAIKTLFGYTRRVIESSIYNKDIKENPIASLKAKEFYQYKFDSKQSKKEKIINEEDLETLNERYKMDHIKNPEYIPTYAVELAGLTGMRVGEIAALSWNKIFFDLGYILIDSSEKYNRKTKQYYISKTKNKKERKFPLTDEICKLLMIVKRIEIKYGYICEWVFADENGRIHAPTISSCIKAKCRQEKIQEKGIHAYRRTINSTMRTNGTSAVVAAALLGHSPQVNEQYYTFDVSTMEQKNKIISQANQEMKKVSCQGGI